MSLYLCLCVSKIICHRKIFFLRMWFFLSAIPIHRNLSKWNAGKTVARNKKSMCEYECESRQNSADFEHSYDHCLFCDGPVLRERRIRQRNIVYGSLNAYKQRPNVPSRSSQRCLSIYPTETRYTLIQSQNTHRCCLRNSWNAKTRIHISFWYLCCVQCGISNE